MAEQQDAPPHSNAADAPDGQQELVDELIFKRDVNEGFLLIDHISGRSEKSLRDLDVDKLVVPGELSPATPSMVLRKFCEIRYPPDTASRRVKAEDAAFVLEVKDRLNALARPARGISIAYTAIFIGSAVFWTPKASMHQRTLVAQAEDAFPNIARHARWFARLFTLGLPTFLVIWFLLTAFTYWDLGYGGSIVQTIQQLSNQRSALLQSSGGVGETPETCKALMPNSLDGRDRRVTCANLAAIDSSIAGARANLLDFRTEVVGEAHRYLRPIGWGFAAYNPQSHDNPPEQSVTWVLTLFGAYVLPAMFGLLGTMASTVRILQAKARDSLLGPRDLSLSFLGLLTGPLAGLAVGLFHTPSVTSAENAAGLAGSVTLTASGLGFLAGYGADAFFKFLDALVSRVFAFEDGSRAK